MKALHVINNLCTGGAELHLLTLCRQLKRQGVEIVVACLKEQASGSRLLRPDFEKEGIRVISLGAERNFDPRCLMQFMRLVHQEQPDLVHTHLPRADFVGAIGRLAYPSIPWISSIHGLYRNHWSGRWSLPLFHLVWSRTDALIAISQAVKEWLVQDGGIPEARVNVIHYGIDSVKFTGPMADLRGSCGLDGHAIIGTVGGLRPVKGFDSLIRAMRHVREHVPGASLLIAGHDLEGHRETLQRLIDHLGLRPHVRLVGFQADVPSFLHALDVFAFPSRSEGFGQVAIEAMAAGKAVVASRIPPLTEIIVDGETGLLAEPRNPEAFARAIIRLLTDPDLARRMGAQGQKRVMELFDASVMEERTIALYRQCLAGIRGR